MGDVCGGRSDQSRFGRAEDFGETGVGGFDNPIEAHTGDAGRGLIDDRAEFLFALAIANIRLPQRRHRVIERVDGLAQRGGDERHEEPDHHEIDGRDLARGGLQAPIPVDSHHEPASEKADDDRSTACDAACHEGGQDDRRQQDHEVGDVLVERRRGPAEQQKAHCVGQADQELHPHGARTRSGQPSQKGVGRPSFPEERGCVHSFPRPATTGRCDILRPSPPRCNTSQSAAFPIASKATPIVVAKGAGSLAGVGFGPSNA